MYVLIILCCCIGFFQVYNTSTRAKLSTKGLYERWMQQHPRAARVTGILGILLSLLLLVAKAGVGAGTFSFFLLLMSAACYIIALAPLFYIRLKHVLLLSALALLFELILFK